MRRAGTRPTIAHRLASPGVDPVRFFWRCRTAKHYLPFPRPIIPTSHKLNSLRRPALLIPPSGPALPCAGLPRSPVISPRSVRPLGSASFQHAHRRRLLASSPRCLVLWHPFPWAPEPLMRSRLCSHPVRFELSMHSG